MKKNYNIWVVSLPFVICTSLAIGILIGASAYSRKLSLGDPQKEGEKFKQILRLLEKYYVDTVDLEKFTEKAIQEGLSTLDPHSVYRSKEEADWSNKQLEGSFEGIGIEFDIFEDTMYVRRTIQGGPSEEAGLKAGDQLIFVDKKSFTPKGLNEKHISEKLRGTTGTKVLLKVRRGSTLHEISVTRGPVPLPAVGTRYMISKEVGYVLLLRFSAKSHRELTEAMDELRKEGMKQLILDLRGNGGGYMQSAVEIADEFLVSGKMIVRTRGRTQPERTYEAKKYSLYEQMPLIILIDHRTASASEIVVGALQDNRRAVIVGSRSYGKALVQEALSLLDGSEIRLTTARYYTPKGRSIQKPYELVSPTDSLQQAVKEEVLSKQKGGILPDVLVEEDTMPTWLQKFYQSGALQAYARHYYVEQTKAISTLQSPEELRHLLQKRPIERDKISKLCKSCILLRENVEQKKILTQHLEEQLAYMRWGILGPKKLLAPKDLVLQAALQQWKKARTLVKKK